MILFPFEPDWSTRFRVDLAYRTEIITSRAEREQRIANRPEPRKTYEFNLRLSRGRLAGFQAFMAKNQQGRFVLRDETRSVELAAPVTVGQTSITLAEAVSWATPGSVIVLGPHGASSFATVAAVAGSAVTLQAPGATRAHAASERVSAAVTGVVQQELRGQLFTREVGEASIIFSADPGSFSEFAGSAPQSFNGRELFLTRPNWAAPPSLDLRGYLETLDFTRGAVEHFSRTPWNTRRLQMSYLGRDRAATEAFLRFFVRAKGQRGEFYMPTWEPDIGLTIGAASGSALFDVPGSDLFLSYAGSQIYEAMIVFFEDGAYEAHRIASITGVAGNSRITTTAPWSRAVNFQTAYMACFLPVWRFAVDNLSFEWQTSTVAQWRTTVQTIEDLP